MVPYGSTSAIKNKLFPHTKAQRALRFLEGMARFFYPQMGTDYADFLRALLGFI
jgi:hypothetical protein